MKQRKRARRPRSAAVTPFEVAGAPGARAALLSEDATKIPADMATTGELMEVLREQQARWSVCAAGDRLAQRYERGEQRDLAFSTWLGGRPFTRRSTARAKSSSGSPHRTYPFTRNHPTGAADASGRCDSSPVSAALRREQRFKFLLAHGQTGLRGVGFSHADGVRLGSPARQEVAAAAWPSPARRHGTLFDGIPLDRVSTSMIS
jgi:hypothetical protein